MNHPARPVRNKTKMSFCWLYLSLFCAELKVRESQVRQVYLLHAHCSLVQSREDRHLVFWFSGLKIHYRRLLTWAPDRLDIKYVTLLHISVGEETASELCHKQRKEGTDYQDIDRSDQPCSGLSSCQNIKWIDFKLLSEPFNLKINGVNIFQFYFTPFILI